MSDILFDATQQITVQCDNLKVEGHDFLLDSASRRKAGNTSAFRRAIVHDQGDGLTVNFANDYPGGVTLNGVAAITPLSTPKPIGVLNRTNALIVHGDISYEVHGPQLVSGGSDVITTTVATEAGKLQGLINELTARVTALEAKVK
jgi:hypothetical protein